MRCKFIVECQACMSVRYPSLLLARRSGFSFYELISRKIDSYIFGSL